jgi:hypothetical protein
MVVLVVVEVMVNLAEQEIHLQQVHLKEILVEQVVVLQIMEEVEVEVLVLQGQMDKTQQVEQVEQVPL